MKKLFKFSKYSGAAAASAASDWAVFTALFVLSENYLFAQGLARLTGGLVSFFLNRVWTFEARETSRLSTQGRRFLLLYAASYGLSVLLLSLFVEVLDWTPYIGKLAADIACFAFNFAVMRVYVFDGRGGVIAFIRGLRGRRAAD